MTVLSAAFLDQHLEARPFADNLARIGERFAGISYPAVKMGDCTIRGLSWRCQAIASANLLRGEELFGKAIAAINDGEVVTAHLLVRALDETLAAVIFAGKRLQRAVEAGDPKVLAEVLNRVSCGNKYMSTGDSRFPPPFNVLKMIDETAKYLDDLVQDPPSGYRRGVFREHYEMLSETAHPSQGSFAIYQRTNGDSIVFTRANALAGAATSMLLSALEMSASLLIDEGLRLRGIEDLPEGWPTSVSTQGRT